MRVSHLLSALAVVALLLLWVGAPLDRSGATPPPPGAAAAQSAPPVKVVAFRSTAEPVDSAVLLRGRTEARRNVDLRAETAGVVATEPRRAGAEVAAGELLCRIESGPREAALAEARARLAQARADANAADTLSERGLASENSAIAARAALEAAEAGVRIAEIEIERLELRAPFDGVLETDTAELGALLRVGDVCARLISLDPIELVGFVPETEVDALRPGMPAFARLVSGRELQGEIVFVSRSADPTTRTYRVEITAPNPDRDIRDGMTAEILVPLAPERAHLAPQSALTLDDGGRLGVRLVQDGHAVFAPAEILRETPDGVWLAGLPEEASIVYVGQEYVSDGRAVDVTYEDRSPAR